MASCPCHLYLNGGGAMASICSENISVTAFEQDGGAFIQ